MLLLIQITYKMGVFFSILENVRFPDKIVCFEGCRDAAPENVKRGVYVHEKNENYLHTWSGCGFR